jgi:hypothetical protein
VTRAKPATVRFYFDADVLGLAKILCQERSDFTYPGDPGQRVGNRERPACPITTTAIKDSDWIPRVAAEGWVIITRDHRIQEQRAEINAVVTHKAKMVNLSSRDATTKWTQLEVFMTRWRLIDALADQPGPFIYQASRTGAFQPLDLGALA